MNSTVRRSIAALVLTTTAVGALALGSAVSDGDDRGDQTVLAKGRFTG